MMSLELEEELHVRTVEALERIESHFATIARAVERSANNTEHLTSKIGDLESAVYHLRGV